MNLMNAQHPERLRLDQNANNSSPSASAASNILMVLNPNALPLLMLTANGHDDF